MELDSAELVDEVNGFGQIVRGAPASEEVASQVQIMRSTWPLSFGELGGTRGRSDNVQADPRSCFRKLGSGSLSKTEELEDALLARLAVMDVPIELLQIGGLRQACRFRHALRAA